MNICSLVTSCAAVLLSMSPVLHITEGASLPEKYNNRNTKQGNNIPSTSTNNSKTLDDYVKGQNDKTLSNLRNLYDVLATINRQSNNDGRPSAYFGQERSPGTLMKDVYPGYDAQSRIDDSLNLETPADNKLPTVFMLHKLAPFLRQTEMRKRQKFKYPLTGIQDDNGARYNSLSNAIGFSKRKYYHCDFRKFTVNTIMEYLRSGKICGARVANVRFGLGKR